MHDLHDYVDGDFCDPAVVTLEGAPPLPWEHRTVMVSYFDGDATFLAWWCNGYGGATIVTDQDGTAIWADGSTSAVTRLVATDIAAEPDTEATGGDLFKRYYIDRHPEQVWKRAVDLAVGDRVWELTVNGLGIGDEGLPVVIDRIGPVVRGRRESHYVASRACHGASQPQGARLNMEAQQWARLDDRAGVSDVLQGT